MSSLITWYAALAPLDHLLQFVLLLLTGIRNMHRDIIPKLLRYLLQSQARSLGEVKVYYYEYPASQLTKSPLGAQTGGSYSVEILRTSRRRAGSTSIPPAQSR